MAVLDPDVVLTADPILLPAGMSAQARGAEVVAGRARAFRAPAEADVRVAVVDGAVGVVTLVDGVVAVVFAPTVEDDRIVSIDIIAEPERLARVQVVQLPV